MTGQRAAQRKNSPRQWGRPFGRAPREICPAISTHRHWGGDCITTMKWQDAVAANSTSFKSTCSIQNKFTSNQFFGCLQSFYFRLTLLSKRKPDTKTFEQ